MKQRNYIERYDVPGHLLEVPSKRCAAILRAWVSWGGELDLMNLLMSCYSQGMDDAQQVIERQGGER